eukprot:9438165-Pyramimonas_sp.AAC.1
MIRVYDAFYCIHPSPGDIHPRKVQRYIQRLLVRGNPLEPPSGVILPGLRKWLPSSEGAADLTILRFEAPSNHLPSYISTALLKSARDAWNTSRRYRCGARA